MLNTKRFIDFYKKVISEEFIKKLVAGSGVKSRGGIYQASIAIWLMLFQRLNPDCSLAAAVEELRSGNSKELLERAGGSIRARGRRTSGNTGGYAQARERLSLKVVEKVSDELAKAITEVHSDQKYAGYKLFAIAGTTIRIAHTKENITKYKCYSSPQGSAHFPLIRVGIATDMVTGTTVRPAFCPYKGDKAAGELELAEATLAAIPKKSVVIADRYYGCYRFILEASHNEHLVICRVKELCTKRYIGMSTTEKGEMPIELEPPKKHAGNSPIKGRLIWHTFRYKGFRPTKIFLFTNLDLPTEKILEMYGLRWNIETDLRNIKATLDMDDLYAKTPGMAEKEIILGITAYNLVRHFLTAAAKAARCSPREISFTRVLKRVMALGSAVISGSNFAQDSLKIDKAFSDLNSLRIPKRKSKPPSEPRKVWTKSQINYMHGSRNLERQRLVNP